MALWDLAEHSRTVSASGSFLLSLRRYIYSYAGFRRLAVVDHNRQ